MPCTLLISPNNMTSNSAPAPYEAIAESELGVNNKAFQAFDGNETTSTWASDPDHDLPTWLFINLGSAKLACAYALRCASANYPTDWIFQGSNDRSNFTTLDTQVNQYIQFDTQWYGTFVNETAYQYYMWTFTGTSDEIIAIGEAKIFVEEIAGIRDVISTGCIPFSRT